MSHKRIMLTKLETGTTKVLTERHWYVNKYGERKIWFQAKIIGFTTQARLESHREIMSTKGGVSEKIN